MPNKVRYIVALLALSLPPGMSAESRSVPAESAASASPNPISEALCGPYRVYVVCVPPPPSSGVALLQMLAILDRTDIDRRGADDPQAWYLFAEASRLMYADRDRYVADLVAIDVTCPPNGIAGEIARNNSIDGKAVRPIERR